MTPGHDLTVAPGEPAWHRLSPRMLAVHPVREVARYLPALVVLIFLGRSNGDGGLWVLIGLVAAVGVGVLRWATTGYRVTAEQVQIRRGILSRSVLSVPRDRVRTVDLTARALHRVLGLARLTIGTGVSDRKEEGGLTLDALTVDAAQRLRAELLHRDVVAPAGAAPAAAAWAEPETVLTQLRPSWLRYGPWTLSGLVTVGVVVGFGWRILNEAQVNPEKVGPIRSASNFVTDLPLAVAILIGAVVAVAAIAALSTAAYALAYWGFRLTRGGGNLHVARGLITARSTTIEERRLRGVELSEPLLLRVVRGARLIAITTGLRVGRGAERGGTMLVPPADRVEAIRVGGAVLYNTEPMIAPLRGHGPRARRRRFTRALVPVAVLAAALALAWWLLSWPAWPVITALVLLPLAAAVAADRAASLGHSLVPNPDDGSKATLVARQGSIVRRRYALSCDGIIGWTVHRSFFQRRAGLVTLAATTAAGRQHYPILDLSPHQAISVADAAVPGLLTPFLIPAVNPAELS